MTISKRRDVSRYPRTQTVFPSFEDFLETEHLPTEIITIDGAQPLDIFYLPTGSKTTVVSFHAAIAGQDAVLPMFSGFKVTQDHSPNQIFISDPGLLASDDLTIGWFSGTDSLPLQTLLPKVLAKLIEQAGGTRTLFWGPSAGGFAALFYSKYFPGSLAVPVNPQTILANFNEIHQKLYTHAAFGADSDEAHSEVFSKTLCTDLRLHYRGETPNYILYVQNETDPHVELHMEPFLSSLHSLERVKKIWGNWGEGHVAPTSEQLREIISSVTNPELDWDLHFSNPDYSRRRFA
ncbi:hypothetical protein [Paenarthrobacter sp. NPDC058040]|uniref:hypothetical protein n=1 Tax=unclassified Paenarthrobacter TaxID=2634190 RepID=UPI0036DBD809